MKKRMIPVVLIALVMFTTSCGQAPGSANAKAAKTFKWVSPNLDSCVNPHDSNAVANYEIVGLIMSALYCWAPAESRDKAVLIPCLAAGEPATADGLTWHIEINPDARWANGEAITAETFIYSWKMGLDPKLAYSSTSGIANQYITVVNAFEYYIQTTDNPVDWETVGFKAVGPLALEITTTQVFTTTDVMRHFAHRVTDPVYEPLYEAGMNADRTNTRYGTDLDLIMCNGPFVLTQWVKGSERVLVKNENYILADMVKLDGIDCRVVQDEATRLELFANADSDYIDLGVSGLALYGEDPGVLSFASKTIRTIEANRNSVNNPILTDPKFRKALYYATDRETVASLTHGAPAPFFISTAAEALNDGTLYRDMDGANEWLPDNYGYDPELAKVYFQEVLEQWGLTSVSLTLTYSEDIPSLRAASEYLQSQWTELFGADSFTLKLSAMPHSAVTNMMRESVKGPADWDLCWSGWTLAAETFAPHAKFAPYRSDAPNRYTNYTNAFLDERYPLFADDAYRLDAERRFELTLEIEKNLILDDVTCIPVFQEVNYSLFSRRVRLAVDNYAGMLGFGWEYADIAD